MFRKTLFQITAAFILLMASFSLIMPTNVYAQTSTAHPQSAQYGAAKCEKIKDKKKKKECQKKETKKSGKKNDDGPNHHLNDDHGTGNDDGPNHQ